MNDVVLYSGGLDSFLVHQYLKRHKIDHELIYFDLGGKYSNCELDTFNKDSFKKHIKLPVTISSCLSMGTLEDETAYIPNRNILTAIMANSVTLYDNIWIGGTLSDRVNDNNKKVFMMLSRLLSHMHQKKISVDSPFWDFHKADIVKDYVDHDGWGCYQNKNEARDSLIESTFSCYYPLYEEQESYVYYFDEPDISFIDDDNLRKVISTKECLCCPACFRKCVSLYAGGIFIPMKICKKTNEVVEKYENEAKKYFDSNKSSDTNMESRFRWTLRYCDALRRYWTYGK